MCSLFADDRIKQLSPEPGICVTVAEWWGYVEDTENISNMEVGTRLLHIFPMCYLHCVLHHCQHHLLRLFSGRGFSSVVEQSLKRWCIPIVKLMGFRKTTETNVPAIFVSRAV